MREIRPEVVVHQLTDLPADLDPALMAEAMERMRVSAAKERAIWSMPRLSPGARRFVAQSIAWAYAPGTKPYDEGDPLDLDAEGSRATTVGGVVRLEQLTLKSPPLLGVVLRYGHLYGPDTGLDGPARDVNVQVDAAAHAAALAVEKRRHRGPST